MPSEQELNTYYESDYRGQGKLFSVTTNNGPWDSGRARARAQVAFSKPFLENATSWLDIGAGYGLLLDELQGIEHIGAIEPEPYGASRIREQGYPLYIDLETSGMDWNVISFSHLLEHISNPRAFLTNVHAHLIRDGIVFCEVPYVAETAAFSDDTPHVLFFNKASLKSLFERSGFEILRIELCGPPEKKIASLTRRAMRLVVPKPLSLLDQILFRHFQYTNDGVWLRLAARRT